MEAFKVLIKFSLNEMSEPSRSFDHFLTVRSRDLMIVIERISKMTNIYWQS